MWDCECEWTFRTQAIVFTKARFKCLAVSFKCLSCRTVKAAHSMLSPKPLKDYKHQYNSIILLNTFLIHVNTKNAEIAVVMPDVSFLFGNLNYKQLLLSNTISCICWFNDVCNRDFKHCFETRKRNHLRKME